MLINGYNLECTPNDLNDLGSYKFEIILSDDFEIDRSYDLIIDVIEYPIPFIIEKP